jgi:pimeloyl-ACP methyl ester carboxylesterase
MKFVSEYDTDFSRATIDGNLSKDFSPQETLQKVSCPMLLLRVEAYRHETWGIIGAIDDEDAARIVALVKDLKCVPIQGGHGIHIEQPARYIAEVTTFIDDLQAQGKLPVVSPQPV